MCNLTKKIGRYVIMFFTNTTFLIRASMSWFLLFWILSSGYDRTLFRFSGNIDNIDLFGVPVVNIESDYWGGLYNVVVTSVSIAQSDSRFFKSCPWEISKAFESKVFCKQ